MASYAIVNLEHGGKNNEVAPGTAPYHCVPDFSANHPQQRLQANIGSVATVYKAIDQRTGRVVVLKIYDVRVMRPQHTHKMQREIHVMKRLSGPLVTQLLDVIHDDNLVCLVLEYYQGGDLYSVIREKAVISEQWLCLMIILPLLRALEKMHSLGMMHRDIKAENIFLEKPYGGLRLGDFGLALDWRVELAFTRSGTLDYMAPECLQNPETTVQESVSVNMATLDVLKVRPYSCVVDVWATGILAYELMAGRPPFQVPNLQATVHNILYKQIPYCDRISPPLFDFILQALTKEPLRRPSASMLLVHPWIQIHLHNWIYSASSFSEREERQMMSFPLPLVPQRPSNVPMPHSSMAQAQSAIPRGERIGAGGPAACAPPGQAAASPQPMPLPPRGERSGTGGPAACVPPGQAAASPQPMPLPPRGERSGTGGPAACVPPGQAAASPQPMPLPPRGERSGTGGPAACVPPGQAAASPQPMPLPPRGERSGTGGPAACVPPGQAAASPRPMPLPPRGERIRAGGPAACAPPGQAAASPQRMPPPLRGKRSGTGGPAACVPPGQAAASPQAMPSPPRYYPHRPQPVGVSPVSMPPPCQYPRLPPPSGASPLARPLVAQSVHPLPPIMPQQLHLRPINTSARQTPPRPPVPPSASPSTACMQPSPHRQMHRLLTQSRREEFSPSGTPPATNGFVATPQLSLLYSPSLQAPRPPSLPPDDISYLSMSPAVNIPPRRRSGPEASGNAVSRPCSFVAANESEQKQSILDQTWKVSYDPFWQDDEDGSAHSEQRQLEATDVWDPADVQMDLSSLEYWHMDPGMHGLGGVQRTMQEQPRQAPLTGQVEQWLSDWGVEGRWIAGSEGGILGGLLAQAPWPRWQLLRQQLPIWAGRCRHAASVGGVPEEQPSEGSPSSLLQDPYLPAWACEGRRTASLHGGSVLEDAPAALADNITAAAAEAAAANACSSSSMHSDPRVGQEALRPYAGSDENDERMVPPMTCMPLVQPMCHAGRLGREDGREEVVWSGNKSAAPKPGVKKQNKQKAKRQLYLDSLAEDWPPLS